MFNYTTKETFRRFANELPLNEQTTIKRSAQQRQPSNATFLSHSSKDEDLVVGALRVIEGHGGVAYLDKKDPTLPPYTSKETAKTLKDRIGQCGRFILLASENSKNSNWVPWELGIADGKKGLDRIAIFPAVDSGSDTWPEWEYMGLYPKVVWGDLQGHSGFLWIVRDSATNTAVTLSEWLRR
ncbi:toll/interleukin-1 receptor domain-containing protein [Devosia faecipullorum]|uniref:toll/interleukin-1 receptor domain-containing protein n=1 Tax=Devosia faecipullorum TaxID=2755039 RepID=UPI00187B9657|nr:toll/interleukin-1 receptor domain-containing protein [Devosia faecipullorum]MBE7731678.1 toll/interleukin-1 receptor domain-containing protein [Devosia faecipullorum]